MDSEQFTNDVTERQGWIKLCGNIEEHVSGLIYDKDHIKHFKKVTYLNQSGIPIEVIFNESDVIYSVAVAVTR